MPSPIPQAYAYSMQRAQSKSTDTVVYSELDSEPTIDRISQCERLVTVVPPGSKLPAIWQSWSYLFATARCAQQKHEWRATSMVPHGAQCQKLRGLGLLKRLGHRHSHFVGAAVPVSSLSSSFTIVKPILSGSTPWYCRPQTYYRNVSREVLVLEVAAKNLDVEAVLRLPT